MRSDDTKQIIPNLSAMLAACGATAIAMVVEAWFATGTEEDIKNYRNMPRISERPDRMECVLITRFTPDSTDMYMGKILRDAEGNPSAADWEHSTAKDSVGLLGRNPFDHPRIVPPGMATADSLSKMITEFAKSNGMGAIKVTRDNEGD